MAGPVRSEELEKLFLLELLVDNIQFDWSKIDIDKEVLPTLKQTCIRFQFLNYPILEVSEEDFCESNENPDENGLVSFKCGKSCLFSLRSVTPELRCFMIRATVLKKKDPPPHHVLGKACINLGQSFINVINSLQAGNDEGPMTETVKDKYSIRIPNGTEIGKLTLFTRLSCFGKMIITQFQITDEEKKTFFFKGDETKIAAAIGDGPSGNNFMIKRGPFPGDDERNVQSANMPYDSLTISSVVSRGPLMTDGYTHLGNMTNLTPFPEQQPPFGMTQSPFGMAQPPFGMTQPPFGMTQTPAYFSLPPTPRRPEDLLGGAGGLFGGSPFGVFGSTFVGSSMPLPIGLLGGNPDSLMGPPPGYTPMGYGQQSPTKNRKQKYPNFPFCGGIPRADESSSSDEEETIPPPPVSLPPLNLCECDYPLPPSFGMPSPPPPPPKKKKKNKKKNKCPYELGGNFCFKPDCPMGYPSFGGMQTAQCSQMQMPPNTLALKEDQVIFQVPPYVQPSYGVFGANWNPTDMYSMKVGRRVNNHDQNTKVEVQFEPPPKKNICKLDVETQYSPTDFGGAVEGADKGKTPKGKGKKGKKK